MKLIIRAYIFILPALALSCKKFISIDPPRTSLIAETVFKDDATAMAAMMAVYSSMSSADSYNLTFYNGLAADELTNISSNPTQGEFFNNSLTPNNATIRNVLWGNLFKHIYESNAIIEGLNRSVTISADVRQQLLGEAHFVRAFWNFYLANMFGDIPHIDTTLYQINMNSKRVSKTEIIGYVISDLITARALLTDEYKDGRNNSSTERVRPNAYAARAFLARVFLYAKNWEKAKEQATAVIDKASIYQLESLDNVFLTSSRESIWQLMPVNAAYNSVEGNQFILTGRPNSSHMNKELVLSFESPDLRRNSWVNFIVDGSDTFYFPFKYKIKSISPGSPWTEYAIVIRLAEMYLIRAEASMELEDHAGAIQDIDVIRSRAGLAGYSGPANKEAINLAIEKERRSEFFIEWGHRWFDLIRTGRANDLLSSKAPGAWQLNDTLYPIPQNDILANPNLTQNAGY